jgi:hypothetical protein
VSRGGKREGAGRKPGSGKGRVSVTRSVSMSEESWDALDAARGEQSRGEWIASRLPRSPKKARRAKGQNETSASDRREGSRK